MKVLLTGSAGFIGGEIKRQLQARGDDVVGVDLMLAMAHGDSKPPEGTHQIDVRDSAEDTSGRWAELLAGVDVVCHQAAVVGAGVTVADLPAYASHNDLGTASLLAAMAGADVHAMVLASSMVVYGEGRYDCPQHGQQAPPPRTREALDGGDFDNHCPVCGDALGWELVDEDARMDPRSTYAVSKLAQEHYTAAWVRQAPGRAIALRYHNVYGPGMPRDTPYSGVAAMFRSSLERGEAPQVYEDGTQMRDFVHVSDVARANLLAIDGLASDQGERFEAYNVCSGQPVAIADVARKVASGTQVSSAQGVGTQGAGAQGADSQNTEPQITGSPSIEPQASGSQTTGSPSIEPQITGGYRLGDVRHIVASSAKAREELGFVAQVSPEQGLAEFATAPLRA
ncbi:NAD-dependent epimerase/dehydratase family protein [soil metagenome]